MKPSTNTRGSSARLWIPALLLLLSQGSQAAQLYVSLAGHHVPPFTNWVNAATNIQAAVDAASTGDIVWVTNGVYATGGRAIYGTMTNRVAVNKPLILQSLHGPQVTVIQGYQMPDTTNGNSALRCVYLTNGAILSGFTLTNGATLGAEEGGGVWCESTNAVLTNCWLMGNSADLRGGGACSGTLNNCVLAGNSVTLFGGGAYSAALNNCTLTNNTAQSGGGVYSSTLFNCALAGNRAADSYGGAYEGTLNNCTLTGNSAPNNGGGAGFAALTNCLLIANSAGYIGGGAESSTLVNCALVRNHAAVEGGGAYSCTMYNCTLTGNSVPYGRGGGASSGTLNNCLLYYNDAALNPNYYFGNLNYCCTIPLPSGTSNIVAEPQLSSACHITAGSPCRRAGAAAYAKGVDIDGEAWNSPPAIGCDEYPAASIVGPLAVAILAPYKNVVAGFPLQFAADIAGEPSSSRWDFGDGSSNTNQPFTSHIWNVAGDYQIVLRACNDTYPAGISATAIVHVVAQPVHYVSVIGTNPLPPYTNWATAATVIQDALDAVTVPGALVLVSNGVYATGGRALIGVLSNRVVLDKPLVLQSLNGLAVTVIQGSPESDFAGLGAARCAYLCSGAALVGFTLTNGAATTSDDLGGSGGGVWCASPTALVTNCLLIGNLAQSYGGAAYNGLLNDCTLMANSANSGGGAYNGNLVSCTLSNNSASSQGGAAYGSTLTTCTLMANSAPYGGAAYESGLTNCTLSANSASFGGGVHTSTGDACTFTSNSASFGGASAYSTLNRSTLMANWATNYGGGDSGGILNDCTLTGNWSASYAGGTSSGKLNRCTLIGNSAKLSGGGAHLAYLTNCALIANTAKSGGGADSGWLNNCTVVGNWATNTGGGAYSSFLYNSVLYYNTAASFANSFAGTLNYCCTTPAPSSGGGNITNEPLFVNYSATNLHLQASSPCINAGRNAYALASTDLDGSPRISGARVDLGASEFQNPASMLSYAWAQEYGIPTDGSADYADPDHDGLNNSQESLCLTDPTNAASGLLVVSATPATTNVIVTWQSVAGLTYFLQRSTNLAMSSPWAPVATNRTGKAGTTSYTHTNAAPASPAFYRVGLQ